ncbi:MAG: hypothetical protein M1812_001132 [Candelaria pacifica]|nr:MAG: hypothetical protein M1812_001132 [Candelaria pacifica]
MGPALQRLLAKPSALKLLRTLVSCPDTCADPTALPPCYISLCRLRKTGRQGMSTGAEGSCKSRKNAIEPIESPNCAAVQCERVPTVTKEFPLLVRSRHPNANKDGFTFERLLYESNVGEGDLHSRLVDTPPYRHDFRFWVEILEFRSRLHGSKGIANIWRGILARNINLPVEGPEADILWKAFLRLGFTDTCFLHEIWDYAHALQQSSGRRWLSLYETIIGHLLDTRPKRAYEWHNRLRKDHPPRPGGLQTLLDSACSSKGALHAFWIIYVESEERSIYTKMIPLLCERRLFDAAYKWHNLLIRKGDLPSSSKIAEPLMHHLALYGKPDQLRDLTHRMVDAGVSYASSTVKIFKDNTLISRDIMNRIIGDVHGIEPKTLSDSFCARLFATKAFSVDTVLKGIQMLGVEAIGPLAMQAMTLRDPTPIAFLDCIDKLKASGISIGMSVFIQSLRKAAIENKTQVFLDILCGDQHPDVLEDWKAQEATLAWAFAHRQWRVVNKTLLILTTFSGDTTVTWNLVLRAHLNRQNLRMVKQTLEEMRMHNIEVSMVSVRYLCQQVLRTRRPGKRPFTFPPFNEDLSLVVNILMSVLRAGTDLPPVAWTEVLKRLGMTGRLQEFEKLALWLADWYTPKSLDGLRRRLVPFRAAAQAKQFDGGGGTSASSTEAEVMPIRLPSSHPRHPLKLLFPKELQSAIIAWNIRKALTGSSSSHKPNPNLGVRQSQSASSNGTPSTTQQQWIRGLQLLKALKSRGVLVHTNHVRKALKLRLRILYGRNRESNRLVNRVVRRRNPFKLEEMVKIADQNWGNQLFGSLLGPPDEGDTQKNALLQQNHVGISEPFDNLEADADQRLDVQEIEKDDANPDLRLEIAPEPRLVNVILPQAKDRSQRARVS